ncbi:hypothetical protein PanWU01x14_050820 [Parasponia andersonii]|uniref:Uncharacterized protein n=1 Tax=Parasponia andersonii TaxID=3476 RepID=A0A2P5DLT1_PARAD|nr:hypothetical protein PanWU01x14_050820 [Parasponia andersonii]
MINDPTILGNHEDPVRNHKLKTRNGIKDNGSDEQGISNAYFKLTKPLLSDEMKNKKGQNRGTETDEAKEVANFSMYHNGLGVENLVHEVELVLHYSESASSRLQLEKITSTRFSMF